MDIGKRIHDLREERGLTQREVARRAGLTPSGVGFIEHGQTRNPSAETVVAIARALGVPVEELLEEPALAVGEAEAPRETGPSSTVDGEHAWVLRVALENARKAAQPIIEQDDQSIEAYRQALARMKDGMGVSDASFAEESTDLSPEEAEIADLVLEQEQRRRRLSAGGLHER